MVDFNYGLYGKINNATGAMPMAPGSTSGGTGIPTNYTGGNFGNGFTTYAGAPGAAGGATNPFSATPGSTTSTHGGTSTTTPVSGPNGPFAGLTNPLNTSAMAGLTAGQQMLNTAFDPQNALHDRTLQQLQDQARVNSAARGITSSPYGAGLENQATSNFNIDWQNTQLGRQAQGLQGNAAAIAPAAGLYRDQFGSTTTDSGYNTQPGSQGGGASRGAPAASSPGMLSIPNMSTMSEPYVNPIMPQASQAPQWQPVGQNMLTPQGVDYQQFTGGMPQPTAAQTMGALTGTDWSAPTTPNVGGTSMTADQLIGGQAGQVFGGADNFGGMGVPLDQYGLPADGSTPQSFDQMLNIVSNW